jgi:hypothetical protein
VVIEFTHGGLSIVSEQISTKLEPDVQCKISDLSLTLTKATAEGIGTRACRSQRIVFSTLLHRGGFAIASGGHAERAGVHAIDKQSVPDGVGVTTPAWRPACSFLQSIAHVAISIPRR